MTGIHTALVQWLGANTYSKDFDLKFHLTKSLDYVFQF